MAIDTDWTLEQFLRLPEAKPALEFECGRITQKMSPTTDHAVLQKRLCRLFDDLSLGEAFPQLRTILPQASKMPDVAFYVKAELPVSPRGRWLRYPEWTPAIAIEIASAYQNVEEPRAKCRFYVEAGSKLALMVLPDTETIEVFGPGEARRSYTAPAPMEELVHELGESAASITPALIFSSLTP